MAESKQADTATDEATAAVEQRDAQRLRTESAANVDRQSATDLGTHPGIQRATAGAGGRTLIVKHGAVGPYTAGMRVPESGFGEHADMQRLLDLGAVGYEDERNQAPPLQTLDEAS